MIGQIKLSERDHGAVAQIAAQAHDDNHHSGQQQVLTKGEHGRPCHQNAAGKSKRPLQAGSDFGALESVKTSSELIAPIP